MPTDYAKIEIRGIYSKNSDYSVPKVDFNPANYILTPDEYYHICLTLYIWSNLYIVLSYLSVHLTNIECSHASIR